MKLKQKVQEIAKLEVIETPWDVVRVFGKLELFGHQVCMRNESDSLDYVDLNEFRQALNWLTDQAGGYIVWDEAVKGKKK